MRPSALVYLRVHRDGVLQADGVGARLPELALFDFAVEGPHWQRRNRAIRVGMCVMSRMRNFLNDSEGIFQFM